MKPLLATAPHYQGLAYTPDSAISAESGSLRNGWKQFLSELRIVASWQVRLDGFRQLAAVYAECSQDNWDGYGAAGVAESTYKEAVRFLTLLPSTIKTPEIVPEPKGAIAFEWRRRKNFTLVVAVSGRQIVSYAGLFGPRSTGYGTDHFGDAIPGTVITALQRLPD